MQIKRELFHRQVLTILLLSLYLVQKNNGWKFANNENGGQEMQKKIVETSIFATKVNVTQRLH